MRIYFTSTTVAFVMLASFTLVGAAGCGVVSTGGDQASQDKADAAKLEEFRNESISLKAKLRSIQLDMGVGMTGNRGGKFGPHHEFTQNAKYKTTLDDLTTVVLKHNRILSTHPTWTVARLNDNLDDVK